MESWFPSNQQQNFLGAWFRFMPGSSIPRKLTQVKLSKGKELLLEYWHERRRRGREGGKQPSPGATGALQSEIWAAACGCHHLGGVWNLLTCPVRVRVTSLLPIFLLKPSEMWCIFFIQGQNLPSLAGLAPCLWLFPVCCGPPGTQVALCQTMAHCSVFQELSQIWQLFFVTGIKMICRDTRQREREGSDAVRSCQAVCLFALIVAMNVLGH